MCDINFMAICLASCAYIMIPLSQGGNAGPIKVRKGPEKKAYDWGGDPRLSWSGTHALQGKNTGSPRYDEKLLWTKKYFFNDTGLIPSVTLSSSRGMS